MKKKLTYQKPMTVEMGALTPVHGAVCSSGFAATGACTSVGHRPSSGCGNGDDPNVIPYCNTTGNIATADCTTSGNTANSNCMASGATATYVCNGTGSSAMFHI